MASAGPLTARPPISGLTATHGAVRDSSAARMPGTARIGPIEITGLDGPITMASAASSASSTSGVALAAAIPSSSISSISGSARSRMKYS